MMALPVLMHAALRLALSLTPNLSSMGVVAAAQGLTRSPWTLQRSCTACSCWASMPCGCPSASKICTTSSPRARSGTAPMCDPLAAGSPLADMHALIR